MEDPGVLFSVVFFVISRDVEMSYVVVVKATFCHVNIVDNLTLREERE
jgi:hypothetical protein